MIIEFNLNELFSNEYLDGYFSRNKKFFTISIVIFVLFCLIGFLIPDAVNLYDYETENLGKVTDNGLSIEKNIDENSVYDDFTYEETNLNSDRYFEDYNILSFISLFIHNFSIDLSCILGGLLFSIPSLFITLINAMMIGSLFSTVEIPIIILGVLPHGIFEIPSSVFALSGGLMFTLLEFKLLKGIVSRKYCVKDKINESRTLIKDIIITIIIVFTFLYAAALIETFITPLLLILIL